MGLPHNTIFNMVESTRMHEPEEVKTPIEAMLQELARITLGVISVKDIECDIKDLERSTNWKNFSDKQKVEEILNKAEKNDQNLVL